MLSAGSQLISPPHTGRGGISGGNLLFPLEGKRKGKHLPRHLLGGIPRGGGPKKGYGDRGSILFLGGEQEELTGSPEFPPLTDVCGAPGDSGG